MYKSIVHLLPYTHIPLLRNRHRRMPGGPYRGLRNERMFQSGAWIQMWVWSRLYPQHR